MSDDEEGNYDIGYGRPPRNQYPKGTSGNPKGRPKGSKSKKSIFSTIMEERVTADSSKGRKTMPVREAIWRTYVKEALINKNPRALKTLAELDIRYSGEFPDRQAMNAVLKENARLKKENEEHKNRGTGVLVVPAGVSLDEFRVEAEEQRRKMLEDQAAWSKKEELE